MRLTRSEADTRPCTQNFSHTSFPSVQPLHAIFDMAVPAHQRVVDKGAALDDIDTDEELSDEQIRELLGEAEARMRAKQASSQTLPSNAPFRLPKLRPGHIADTYLKTDGSVTRPDPSQLISAKDRALADGVKKIEDPVQVKEQKELVRPNFRTISPRQ